MLLRAIDLCRHIPLTAQSHASYCTSRKRAGITHEVLYGPRLLLCVYGIKALIEKEHTFYSARIKRGSV
jgi:hypothetical protein